MHPAFTRGVEYSLVKENYYELWGRTLGSESSARVNWCGVTYKLNKMANLPTNHIVHFVPVPLPIPALAGQPAENTKPVVGS